MDKVFYMFPEAMRAGQAARACMEATGETPTVTRYLFLKIEIEEGRDVLIPRKAAEMLMRTYGGAIYEMPATGTRA